MDLIERIFQKARSLYIACIDRNAFFTSDAVRNYNLGRTNGRGLVDPPPPPPSPSNFIASRPKAAFLFWFFGGFRCGVPLFIVILIIY